MTNTANNLYYCAKLALKIVDFLVDFGTLRMRHIAPFK